MSEICYRCFKKECRAAGERLCRLDVCLGREYDLCESCGERARTVVRFSRWRLLCDRCRNALRWMLLHK